MGLVLKYVVKTPSGAFQYRRRVPKEVASVIGKREFKQLLGDTERAALPAWPRYNGQVEREIAEAKRGLARGAGAGTVTDREAYLQARKLVEEWRAAGAPDDLLEVAADSMIEGYRRDPQTGEPLGIRAQRHELRYRSAVRRCLL